VIVLSYVFNMSLRVTGNTATVEYIKARTFLVADNRIIYSKHIGTVSRTGDMQYLAIVTHLLK
jgi:hypothetical protein